MPSPPSLESPNPARFPKWKKVLVSSFELLFISFYLWDETDFLVKNFFEGGVYCICRVPDGEFGSMIACDDCEEWFHMSCVDVPEESAGDIAKYSCPSCCTKREQPYPFSKPEKGQPVVEIPTSHDNNGVSRFFSFPFIQFPAGGSNPFCFFFSSIKGLKTQTLK